MLLFQPIKRKKKTSLEWTDTCFSAHGVGSMFIGLVAFVAIGQI